MWHHGWVQPSRYQRSDSVLRRITSPVRWLIRAHPLQSWLVVMAVILGLSMLQLRPLALLIAVGWTGYAVFTWVSPSLRRRLRRWR